MAISLKASIQMFDGMTPALKAMRNTMGMLIESFDELQQEVSTNFDTSKVDGMRANFVELNQAINLVETNLGQASAEQDRLNRKIYEADNPIRSLVDGVKSLLGAYAGFQGLQQIASLSDQMSQTKARLSLVVDDGGSVEELQDKIYQAAQATRAPFMATADMVAKLGLQAGQAFSSNDELIAFAEQLNKQFVIAGTSTQGVESVMLQLTQAMASGKLQGEELNAVLDNAQPIVANIKRYLEEVQNIDASNIKQLASEGVLTADVIKNAMFYAAEETNRKFEDMPVTFAQAWQGIKDDLLMTFEPVLSTIAQGAGWIHDNWDDIEPIFWGLAAAVGAYAVALGIQTAATWLAVESNRALMLSMLSNPILWIAVAIGVVVAALYKWVDAVGGVKVAWAIAMDKIKTTWDWTSIGLMTGINWVADGFDRFGIFMTQFSVAVQNIMGDMKAGVLIILQEMINGMIDRINSFIGIVNKVPGVNIDALEKVTFGTNAAIENEAAKQQRNADLVAYEKSVQNAIDGRVAELEQMKADALSATAARQAEIESMKAEAQAKENDPFDPARLASAWESGAIGETAENTAKMADSLDTTTEELEYLRDIAEREAINRFTTAEVKVEMTNNNNISSETDLDGLMDHMFAVIDEKAHASVEGVY